MSDRAKKIEEALRGLLALRNRPLNETTTTEWFDGWERARAALSTPATGSERSERTEGGDEPTAGTLRYWNCPRCAIGYTEIVRFCQYCGIPAPGAAPATKEET